MKIQKILLALLALLALAPAAFAQTDPAKLAVAREVITAMHSSSDDTSRGCCWAAQDERSLREALRLAHTASACLTVI